MRTCSTGEFAYNVEVTLRTGEENVKNRRHASQKPRGQRRGTCGMERSQQAARRKWRTKSTPLSGLFTVKHADVVVCRPAVVEQELL